MIGTVLNLLVLAMAVTLTGVYTKTYISSTDPADRWFTRARVALNKSWVVLWSAVAACLSVVFDVAGVTGDVLGAGAGDQLQAAVAANAAKWLTATVIFITIMSVIARLRSLWRKVSGS